MDFLIDGFPRNQNNLEGWNNQMGEKVNLKFVLFFNCPLEVRFDMMPASHYICHNIFITYLLCLVCEWMFILEHLVTFDIA